MDKKFIVHHEFLMEAYPGHNVYYISVKECDDKGGYFVDGNHVVEIQKAIAICMQCRREQIERLERVKEQIGVAIYELKQNTVMLTKKN